MLADVSLDADDADPHALSKAAVPKRFRGSRGGPAVSFAEEGLEDLCELLGVPQQALRRDPVDQHGVPRLDRREGTPHDIVPHREHRLSAGGAGEGLGPTFVEGHDLEGVVDEVGPHVPLAEETDSDAVDRGSSSVFASIASRRIPTW